MWQLLRSIDRLLYRTGCSLAARHAEAAHRDPPPRREPPTVAEVLAQVQGVVTVSDEATRGFTYGPGFVPSPEPVPETLLPRPSLEGMEFECRQRMAAISRHQVRGFDSGKEHDRMIAALDDALDLYNLAVDALGD